MKSIFFISSMLCLCLMFLTAGCSPSAVEPEAPIEPENQETPVVPDVVKSNTTPSEPSPPYTLNLSFPNGSPVLNQVAELRVVAIHKTRDMNDVIIDVILPEGFELISGNLTWSASSLPYGETEIINARIKAKKTGNWTIEARLNEARSAPEGGARYPIYVSVYEASSEWGKTPPWYGQGGQPVPVEQIAPGDVEPVPSSSIGETDVEDLLPPPAVPVN